MLALQLLAEFGELLGPLAPAELLQRPNLAQFCQHLAAELGPFPRESTQDDKSTKQSNCTSRISGPVSAGTSEMTQEEEDPMVQISYAAAAAGAPPQSYLLSLICSLSIAQAGQVAPSVPQNP